MFYLGTFSILLFILKHYFKQVQIQVFIIMYFYKNHLLISNLIENYLN